MLAGLLAVLKVIGIVLLVIVALILIILLLILFVPLRYKVEGGIPRTNLDEGFDVEKIHVKASFSWLLHFVSGGIIYPENKQFEVRVLGIKVFPFKKKEKKSDKENSTSSGVVEMSDMGEKDVDSGNTGDASDEIVTESVKVESEIEASQRKKSEAEKSTENSADDTKDKKENDESLDDEGDESKSFLDVLWNIIDTITKIIEMPQNVFHKIKYTISRVYDKISMIKSTIENDIFKRAFDLVKRKLIKVIKMVLPDKCDIDVCFGTGDPAQTAEIVGAYSALYPVFYNKVKYEPDFENRVFSLDADIKGHITVFTVVYSAAVCFFNKDVKKVIRRFKKILNSKNN